MKPAELSIVVVDDEQAIREALSRQLRYMGHAVETAAGTADALKLLETHQPSVVISDVRMPGQDGLQLLRAVRNAYPLIRVVMMTGYISVAKLSACIQLGADACLGKPIDDVKLTEALERCWRAREHWAQVTAELTPR